MKHTGRKIEVTSAFCSHSFHFVERTLKNDEVLFILDHYKPLNVFGTYLLKCSYIYFVSPTDMSESDLIYTETLMQRGKENYEGKEIVILGGGDGALLWELLKEKPKFVYMFEVGVFLMLSWPTFFI